MVIFLVCGKKIIDELQIADSVRKESRGGERVQMHFQEKAQKGSSCTCQSWKESPPKKKKNN
jgi:hypothetical protein